MGNGLKVIPDHEYQQLLRDRRELEEYRYAARYVRLHYPELEVTDTDRAFNEGMLTYRLLKEFNAPV